MSLDVKYGNEWKKNKSQNTNIVTVCSTTLVQHALHVIKALQFI